MKQLRLPRLALLGCLALLILSICTAFAATNSVPSTRLDDDSIAIDANALKPASCSSLNLTNIVVGASGTNANDLILGTAGSDNLRGSDGNDCIVGGGGDDNLDGQKGNDILLGGDGNDDLSGGQDDDHLYGQDGDDRLNGGQGTDICDGGPGTDSGHNSCETEINIP
jgi:Ca2+-binding RTX toxin-like protein